MQRFYKLSFTQIIILSLIIRILLSMLPAFEIDQSAFRYWGIRMAEKGPQNFYSWDVSTAYLPGFLYFLWFAGLIKITFLVNFLFSGSIYDLLIKLPANIADILSGSIIYYLVKKSFDKKRAILAFFLYVFNPAIFLNSSVWGQFDGISTLLLLLSVLILRLKKPPEIAAALAVISLTLKPQAIFFAPAFGIFFLLATKPLRWFSSLLTSIVAFTFVYLPFISGNIIQQITRINFQLGSVYSCTTCFALNFWGVFGNWKDDTNLFLNLSLTQWGILLTVLCLIIILFLKPFRIKYREPFVYLTSSLSILTFYTFLTRMHERYIFPFFCFLLLAAFLLKSKKLVFFYFFFSIHNTINLYLAYAYYNYTYKGIYNPPFIDLLMNHFQIISGIFFIGYIGLLLYSVILIARQKDNEN